MAHYYVKILRPKQSMPLPIRSAQIEASLDETNHIDVLHGLSWPKPRKLVSTGIYMRRPRSSTYSMCRHRFFTPRYISITMKALSSINLRSLRIWPLYDSTYALTSLPKFWPHLYAPVDNARSHTRWWTMLMSSMTSFVDVIKCHVSPSYVSSHTARHVSSVASSAPRHLADRWTRPT